MQRKREEVKIGARGRNFKVKGIKRGATRPKPFFLFLRILRNLCDFCVMNRPESS
jgi:hypothetical protein